MALSKLDGYKKIKYLFIPGGPGPLHGPMGLGKLTMAKTPVRGKKEEGMHNKRQFFRIIFGVKRGNNFFQKAILNNYLFEQT